MQNKLNVIFCLRFKCCVKNYMISFNGYWYKANDDDKPVISIILICCHNDDIDHDVDTDIDHVLSDKWHICNKTLLNMRAHAHTHTHLWCTRHHVRRVELFAGARRGRFIGFLVRYSAVFSRLHHWFVVIFVQYDSYTVDAQFSCTTIAH